MSTTMTNKNESLTAEQLERIERNKARALLRRECAQKTSTVRKHQIDSGAGFFIDDTDDFLNQDKTAAYKYDLVDIIQPKIMSLNDVIDPKLHQPGLPCNDCQRIFLSSYLYKNFDEQVCDECRDKYSIEDTGSDDDDDEDNIDSSSKRYSLIPRTEAKEKFMLKDYDLDKHEPVLKCIIKKNPHNRGRGQMRLYLRCQIEKLANIVHESQLDDKIQQRKEKRIERKQKIIEKHVENLKSEVRSSTNKKRQKTIHEHRYDENNIIYDDLTDTYTKTCLDCGHQYSYEEL